MVRSWIRDAVGGDEVFARLAREVQDRDGNELPLIDGGAFDWLARLTSNARNVFVATGMGAQLAALRFRGA